MSRANGSWCSNRNRFAPQDLQLPVEADLPKSVRINIPSLNLNSSLLQRNLRAPSPEVIEISDEDDEISEEILPLQNSNQESRDSFGTSKILSENLEVILQEDASLEKSFESENERNNADAQRYYVETLHDVVKFVKTQQLSATCRRSSNKRLYSYDAIKKSLPHLPSDSDEDPSSEQPSKKRKKSAKSASVKENSDSESEKEEKETVNKILDYLNNDLQNCENDEDSEEEHLIDALLDKEEKGRRKNSEQQNEGPNEVITINDCDGPDDLEYYIQDGKMICPRCLPWRGKFEDKTRFLVHVRRHVAPQHFMCPSPNCGKGFFKLSHCLAHEIRFHEGASESLEVLSSSFIKKIKKFVQKANNNLTTCSSNDDSISQCELANQKSMKVSSSLVSKIDPATSSSQSLCRDYDEDDAYVYNEVIEPSTSLYLCRGKTSHKPIEAYQNQYKYGENMKFSLNTKLSQLLLGRRQEMVHNGLIPPRDDMWNQWQEAKNARLAKENPEAYAAKRNKMVVMNHSTGSSIYETERKTCGRGSCFVCSLCGYGSARVASIRKHHANFHPETKMWDIMHKVSLSACKETSKLKRKSAIDPSLVVENPVRSTRRKSKICQSSRLMMNSVKHEPWKSHYKFIFRKPRRPPSPDYSTKEGFLSALQLIRVEDKEKMKLPCPKMRPAFLKLHKLSHPMIASGKQRFWLCPFCDFLGVNRFDVSQHKTEVHNKDILNQFADKFLAAVNTVEEQSCSS